jgi:hypothetical protein
LIITLGGREKEISLIALGIGVTPLLTDLDFLLPDSLYFLTNLMLDTMKSDHITNDINLKGFLMESLHGRVAETLFGILFLTGLVYEGRDLHHDGGSSSEARDPTKHDGMDTTSFLFLPIRDPHSVDDSTKLASKIFEIGFHSKILF